MTIDPEALAATHAAYAETVRTSPGGTIIPSEGAEGGAMGLRGTAAKPDAGVEVHEGVIGRGGMSVVFEGTQHSLGRPVAVKSAQESEDQARTLLREAWITAQLEHPNVVPVYDLVAASGRPLAVLKRIEGVEWSALLTDDAMVREGFGAGDPQVFHLRTFLSVCNAVHFAHSRGIIHRDLKPENVMVGSFGEVYLVDWGISVSDTPDGPVPYDPNILAGTPTYIAPESLMGQPVDARTDVYLLGGVLFEILAGRPARTGRSMVELITEAMADEPPELPTDVPADLRAICRRCLAREPDDRFPTAEALRSAVEQHLEHRGSFALTEGAMRDLAALEALVEVEAAEDDALRERFTSCRLGFRAALQTWPENSEAREGLRRAVATMVDVEIGRGSAEAARALLLELDDPPAALRARVNEALDRESKARRELLAFRADHDPAVGRKGRFIAALVLTPVILITSLLNVLGVTPGTERSLDTFYAVRLAGPLIQLVALAAVALWQREVLTASLYNRRLLQTAALTFSVQVLLFFGHSLAGVDPAMSQAENFAFVTMALGAMAIFVDNRFTPAVLAYATAFLVATHWPEGRYPAALAASVVLCTVLLLIWRPRGASPRG